MEIKRCEWAGNNPLYHEYHDREWGVPLFDDDRLFEFLVLETFQSGLSWLTILKKRDNFRVAFSGFNYNIIAKYDNTDRARLLNDPGIIRNRLKIDATIANAIAFIHTREEFGSFSKYIWSFTGSKPVINKFTSIDQLPAYTPLSVTISRDMKKRGFRFVGPTVIYAHMQATGMVNDHLVGCFRYHEINSMKLK